MSGCDKSISNCLTYGPVEKIPCTKACKLLGGFDNYNHGSVTNHKCDGREINFTTSTTKKSPENCNFVWSLSETK